MHVQSLTLLHAPKKHLPTLLACLDCSKACDHLKEAQIVDGGEKIALHVAAMTWSSETVRLDHLCILHQAVIFWITLKLIGLFARFQLLIIYVDLPMHVHQGVI